MHECTSDVLSSISLDSMLGAGSSSKPSAPPADTSAAQVGGKKQPAKIHEVRDKPTVWRSLSSRLSFPHQSKTPGSQADSAPNPSDGARAASFSRASVEKGTVSQESGQVALQVTKQSLCARNRLLKPLLIAIQLQLARDHQAGRARGGWL